MPLENFNVWEALFDHTPTPIRYALGILTLGIFTLAGAIWRWNRSDFKRLEDKVDNNIRSIHQRIDQSNREVTQRLDEVIVQLVDISHHTDRKDKRDDQQGQK